ncbi:S-layer homology domain-containing protein [Saccharibacillus sp. CPCC 101409]|uniref:S-layer homology domain-containing protein n=1 Tax=Saccharibacillus sp. CPCC 101409 TaxID=3058041 RepID=UPI002670E89A|nr:S-layer homology domain-containing protein [Saccharibacillus sp. CPCC 101409]MDO3409852.1 S-layer homology domain-containing protein [Saccharibacillus sp. CPCC 101409]
MFNKLGKLGLSFMLLVAFIPVMTAPAYAAGPPFNQTSSFVIQTDVQSGQGFYVQDIQGLPNGSTAVLTTPSGSSSYQNLKVYNTAGSLISNTSLNPLMDTRYQSMAIRMKTLSSGRILIEYNKSMLQSNPSQGTVTESAPGAYFMILDENGNKVLQQTKINTFNQASSPKLTEYVTIAELSNGNIIFSYRRNDNATLATRIFTPSGVAVTNDTLLETTDSRTAQIKAGNGNYVVAYLAGGASNSVYLKFFNNDGSLITTKEINDGSSKPEVFLESLSNGNFLFGTYRYTSGNTSLRIYDGNATELKTFSIQGSMTNGVTAPYKSGSFSGFVTLSIDAASKAGEENANATGQAYEGTRYANLTYYDDWGNLISTTEKVDSGPIALKDYDPGMGYFETQYGPEFRLFSGYANGVGIWNQQELPNYHYSIRVKAFDVGSSQEQTPAAVINYATERLTGLIPFAMYTIDGTGVTADPNGSLAIGESLLGNTIKLVKKGNNTSSTDSEEQSIVLPSRPAVPTGISAKDETSINGNNGILTGVTSAMEYRRSNGTWSAGTGSDVTGLAPDTYEVRTRATASTFASAATSVTIKTFVAPPENTPNAQIDYETEKLTGLAHNSVYVINGFDTVITDADGNLPILNAWFNTTVRIMKTGNGSTTANSAEQFLQISGRPPVPSNIVKTDESAINTQDGTLAGVDSTMEYKRGENGTWTSGTGSTLTGLAPDTYYVRVKGSSTAFVSETISLTIGAFMAVPESIPAGSVDYATEQLTGLNANAAYTVNGISVTTDSNGNLLIEEAWINTVIEIVKMGDGIYTKESPAQSLSLSTRQAAPIGVDKTDETLANHNDGTLIDVTSDMEYKRAADLSWTSGTGSTITGLTPNTYFIRTKATANSFASVPVERVILASNIVVPPAPGVTADDVNNTIVGLDTYMEFSVDDGPYIRYDGTNAPNLSGSHNVKVRIAADGPVPAGPAASLTYTPNVPASGLTVTATDPSGAENDGRTRIAVTPAPTSGHKLMYTIFKGGQAVVPIVGSQLTGYSALPSSGLVSAANGNLIGIAEVDADGKVLKFGTAAAVVVAEPPAPGGGSNTGNPPTSGDTGGGGGTGGTSTGTTGGTSTGTTGGTSTTGTVNVLVNGKQENAGTASTTTAGTVTTTAITVDSTRIQDRLNAEGPGAVVTIPVTLDSNVIVGKLNGQIVKNMENQSATLVLQTNKASYTLPAKEINIEALARTLGGQANLQNIELEVSIGETTASMNQTVAAAAAERQLTLVAPPLDFKVTATYNGTSTEVTNFNAYVKRTVALPDGIDPSRITTGIVVDPDGTVRHVPTKVTRIDGKYYAEINSLTNSTYSVVWHPMTFADVANHWAKAAVNDMSSRMVVNGVSDTAFNPDADITRAEFAAIIVRGLGLKLGSGETSFADVSQASWYAGAVQTTSEYELIAGFEDGTFRPDARITREQAMTIVAKAMKLTGLADRTGAANTGALSAFSDADQAGSWARDNLALAAKAGLITGRSGDKLDAKANVTRAEVAVLIERLLKKSDLID